MGIFIRSQNKRRLIEANIFDIYVADEGVRIEASTEKHTYFLGTYSTEEKALKVLDMIQEQLEGVAKIFSTPVIKEMTEDFVFAVANNMVANIQQRFPIVFQMPNDDEVD